MFIFPTVVIKFALAWLNKDLYSLKSDPENMPVHLQLKYQTGGADGRGGFAMRIRIAQLCPGTFGGI